MNSGPEGIQSLDPAEGLCVLVVDDSRLQRRILTSSLKKHGHNVIEAESGCEALEICKQTPVDLVLSDWMMPGMNGLEFCRAFKALPRESFGYFILLTSKSEKDEIAQGLEAGADDFLTKPVNAHELRARITAGRRIVDMQRELSQKNILISRTLTEISALYDGVERDLIEARKLQQSLVPDRERDFGNAHVSLLLKPAGHVGGDLVGTFSISPSRVGLYAIDVSGHGVTSALMTARLAGYLSSTVPEQNVALKKGSDGRFTARPPAEVVARLNELVLEELETEHYFTMVLADVDLSTGHVEMSQAGHPHPIIQSPGGRLEFLGKGGMPVGLVPNAHYDSFEFQLTPGERILLYSDGITECPDPQGNLLDEAGLLDLMKRNATIRGAAFFESLMWDLTHHADGVDFPDDISGVLFEYRG
ncbi:MAG: SpoIIE family protein phosphatase [Pseudomonadota bacterium]